jgi:hypothetical protein
MADKPEFKVIERSNCPDHPTVEPEVGFGLAGGGYGAYTYCPVCHRILLKTQDPG